MATLLVDTNVASFIYPFKNSPDRPRYESTLRDNVLAISFQTVAELLQWGEINKWGPRRRAGLDQFIDGFVVIPYTRELAEEWARVITRAHRAGRRLEAGDGWIAATAVRFGIQLVTHDKDFAALKIPGLTVISHAP
jgi:predicted nucleic acid-binding protein